MKLNHLIIIGALCGALLLPSSASSWGVIGLSGTGDPDACVSDAKAIGDDTTGEANVSGASGYTQICRVQALCSGTIDELLVYSYYHGVNATLTPCMYSDNEGEPDKRIGLGSGVDIDANDTEDFLNQWVSMPLSTKPEIVKDTYYWVGFGSTVAAFGVRKLNAGTFRYIEGAPAATWNAAGDYEDASGTLCEYGVAE